MLWISSQFDNSTIESLFTWPQNHNFSRLNSSEMVPGKNSSGFAPTLLQSASSQFKLSLKVVGKACCCWQACWLKQALYKRKEKFIMHLKVCKEYRMRQEKGPAFERLLLPEFIRNVCNIWLNCIIFRTLPGSHRLIRTDFAADFLNKSHRKRAKIMSKFP